MDLTRSRFVRLVRTAAAVIGIIIVIAYAAYRSLPYLRGPVIHIFQPVDGSSVSSTTVIVIGRADRVNSLSLNGDPIQVDQSGNFQQTLIVFPGMNLITLTATDQFKRTTSSELDIYGTMDLPEGRASIATTTAK